jgi:streptogramin lyase
MRLFNRKSSKVSAKSHACQTRSSSTFEPLEGRQMFSATPVIWACDPQGRLYETLPTTGAVHVVGKMPTVMYDIAANAQGYLYGVDGQDNLWSINANNASAKKIGSLGVSDNVNSLDFAANGTLYGAGSNLYQINPSNGHATNLGSLKGFTSAGDLCIDNKGRLLLTTNQGDLVQLNPYTHTVTNIGSLGYSQVYGMVYASNGVIYGMSNSTDQIFTINPSNGHGYDPVRMNTSLIGGVNGATTLPTTNIALPPAGQTIYAADASGNLFTLNSATGQTHVIGHMSTVMYDIAFSSSGQLFGVDSKDELWTINPNNASITFFGSLNVSDNISSLTFGPDGYLYAAGNHLYKINVGSRMFYNEGSLGGYTSAGDLAFDKYGQLVMTTTSNQLVSVNPSNASTKLIGNIGADQVLGLAEGNDGVLYGMSDTSDTIFSINPLTGQAYDPIKFSGVNGVYGATVYP